MSGAFELPADLTATLVLVRHGESTYVAEGRFQGRHDPPLSPLGRRQAELVARRLADRNEGAPLPVPPGLPASIWHSPLTRAAETAGLIGGALAGSVTLRASDGLIELAQGEWEGLLHSEVHARWPTELAAWRSDPLHAQAPEGEPLAEAALRVREAVGDILAELAVSRSPAAGPGPDTAGELAAARHQPVPGYPDASPAGRPTEPWAVAVAHDGIFRLVLMTLLGLPIERFWSFPFSLCAISVLSVRDGVAALRAHNLSEHLASLADEERAAEEARGDRRGAL